jgi:sporulation and spore germination protein
LTATVLRPGWLWLAAALALACALPGSAGSSRAVVPSRSAAVAIFAPRGNPGPGCARVYPLRRIVRGPAVLTGAMRALLAGPTARERKAGYGGWFSARTAGKVRSVTIGRRVAHVDFADFSRLIPNASSSCGSALLLAQLDRTAIQFPGVDRAVYSFNGSRRAFYEWLQREAP